MDLTKLTKKPKSERKTVRINLRITPICSQWLTKNNLSPQRIFDGACKELGFGKMEEKNENRMG